MTHPVEEVGLEKAEVVVMLSTVDGVLGAPLAGFQAGAAAGGGAAPPPRGPPAPRPRGAGAAARATAAKWPTPDEAAAEMERALERLVAEDPPAESAWPVRLMGDAIGGATVFKQEHA